MYKCNECGATHTTFIDECGCGGRFEEAYSCVKCGKNYIKDELYGKNLVPWAVLCPDCQRAVKEKADRMFKVLWTGLDKEERECLDELINNAEVFDPANIKEAV